MLNQKVEKMKNYKSHRSAFLTDPKNDNYILRQAFANDYLNREEERELLERIKLHNDEDAREQLVLANLSNVVHVAKEFGGYGQMLNDLIQEGNIGLLKAINNFNLDFENRFFTFAQTFIKSEMYNFAIKNHKIFNVATTKEQRKLFFALNKFKKQLGPLNESEISEISEKLNVKPRTVRDMELKLSLNLTSSFDQPAGNLDTGGVVRDADFGPKDFIASEVLPPEEQAENDEKSLHMNYMLMNAMKTLTTRNKDIIRRRFLYHDKATLQELADDYGVSCEAIRQSEERALKQLKNAMTN